MIIPVKCFTCGKVMADKWLYYQKRVKQIKNEEGMDTTNVIYLTQTNTKKTPECKVMDELGFNKICCRRHILTHVDIE